ncbi:MAG: sigma-70 family RNA polymerase sigma factor [Chthonomonadales bacterium]
MEHASYAGHAGATASMAGRDRTRRSIQNWTDEELVRAAAEGDREAFDILMRRYERTVYHMAYRLTGNSDDAHDVASEAFLRIYRSLDRFRSAATLPAWVNRIVMNVYLDMRRKQQRRPAASLDALAEHTGGAYPAATEDEASSPERHAEHSDRARLLNSAIASLPPSQRVMIGLYHGEGYSYEEIARVMRIPVGTVKSRLNRARLALRAKLAGNMAALLD